MIGDILVKLANSESLTYDETEELRALNFIDVGKPPVRELSQISEDLGHVRFGSVICGTGDPFDTTSGNFSGMGIFNPPLSFTAGDYNLVGCNAGVLQAGISSVDGKFYAAAGDVILDENGISVVSGVAGSNYYKIVDSIGGITNMYISSMIVAADTFTNLVSTNTGGTASISLIAASFGATKTPRIEITAYGGAANFGSIAINANSSQADTTINGTSGVLVRVNASTNNVGIGGAAETGYMLKVTGKIKTDTEVTSPLFTGAVTGAASDNVLKTGDTMTGALTIDRANGTSLISLAGTLDSATTFGLLNQVGMTGNTACYGAYWNPQISGTGTNYGFYVNPAQSVQSTTFYGLYSRPAIADTGAGTQSSYYGFLSIPTVGAASTFTITNTYAGYFSLVNSANATTGTILTNAKLINVAAPTGTGRITNLYGLYMDSLTTGGTLNYAIYTNSGLVHFGDNLDFASGSTITIGAGSIITDTTTGLKIGTGTTQKIGFFNATPVVRQSALTSGLTNPTGTAPGTADYAWGGGTSGGYGFSSADEFRTMITCLQNYRVRINELENRLQNLGLIA